MLIYGSKYRQTPLLTSEKELRLASPSAQHVSLSEISLFPFSCLLGLTWSVLCPASNYIQTCIDLHILYSFNLQFSFPDRVCKVNDQQHCVGLRRGLLSPCAAVFITS